MIKRIFNKLHKQFKFHDHFKGKFIFFVHQEKKTIHIYLLKDSLKYLSRAAKFINKMKANRKNLKFEPGKVKIVKTEMENMTQNMIFKGRKFKGSNIPHRQILSQIEI